ncbi:MAG: NADH-quinone oxidoreductase subunit B family protein [Methanocellales archaeon]|nr:NADH-quinone oxidoreductase subunit B family protein [Methanocellales archaeon]MDD3420689.1 NADH-quinone oxidoreductase subunit B family protein [Methanocellales archaeon]MDD4897861.1 NADH-quinone oxidoreductase subunit B family protein [Methanocellales archaeon]MDD5446427.1 NADH-quinone oxidoreductase subunit B family protein [Methanocellales archaeon]
MNNLPSQIIAPKAKKNRDDEELKRLHLELKRSISSVFGRSIALREVDTGSDGSPEIELVNLTNPYYDIEQYGITFVASPRHADVLIVTGPVTCNMITPLRKAYEATPSPKWVIALGDDACGSGIFKDSYAVIGSVDKVIPVDVKIPGDPPTPIEIIKGLLKLIRKIGKEGY